MNNKKSQISKCLIGCGLLALICGIFCFFGSATVLSMRESIPVIGGPDFVVAASLAFSNFFSFMLGTTFTLSGTITIGEEYPVPAEPVSVNSVGGLTALFVIEMVIIVLAVILLIGILTKKLQKKHITIGCCIVCVLAVVGVILAFCSKKMIVDNVLNSLPGMEEIPVENIYDYFKLGSAGISYGVLGIVGILATGAGLFLGKDEAVVA